MKPLVLVLSLLSFLFIGVLGVDASMYDLVNIQRINNKLLPLKVDKQLEKNATKRACEIKEWSHKGAWSYFVKVRYTLIGENLSKDFNDLQAMEAFMASPTHKKNILEKRFKFIGIGYCGKYIVQHFGGY